MTSPTEHARLASEHAARELEATLAQLATWVGHDTPSGEPALLDALARVLAADCEAAGLTCELVPAASGLHLHAHASGGGRGRIALICHHDTVFPAGTAADRPMRRDGAIVHGPGTADMKGGIALALAAARALIAGGRPFERLELISVPDEEVRAGPFATIERLRGFDAALCLECGRADGSIVSERKGGIWVRLVAVGRPAHAGVEPHNGRSAIAAICREALRLGQLDGRRSGLTAHVTRIEGGEAINAIPARASLQLDLRSPHTADLVWARDEIARFGPHHEVELSLTEWDEAPPLERTPAVEALARSAIELAASLGLAYGDTSTGGVSDGCRTAELGIPTLDGLGPVGGLDHTPDEYIDVSSFAQRVGVLAGLVASVAGRS